MLSVSVSDQPGEKDLVMAVIRSLERELASENSMPSFRGNCSSSN